MKRIGPDVLVIYFALRALRKLMNDWPWSGVKMNGRMLHARYKWGDEKRVGIAVTLIGVTGSDEWVILLVDTLINEMFFVSEPSASIREALDGAIAKWNVSDTVPRKVLVASAAKIADDLTDLASGIPLVEVKATRVRASAHQPTAVFGEFTDSQVVLAAAAGISCTQRPR